MFLEKDMTPYPKRYDAVPKNACYELTTELVSINSDINTYYSIY